MASINIPNSILHTFSNLVSVQFLVIHWVYWVNEQVRILFSKLPNLGDIANPRVGLQTSDNFRF